MSMADNDISKHQLLINSISDSVVAAIEPRFQEQAFQSGAEFDNLGTLIAALVARMEALEKSYSSTVGAKRTPRGAATAAQTDGDDPLDKVKNTMLFARRMWADDEAFRAKYLSESVQTLIDCDDTTTKFPECTEKRWLAEGHLFWRKGATALQKKDIRDEYNRWKDGRARDQLAEPLGADDNGEEDA